MNIQFRASFIRDIEEIKNRGVAVKIKKVVEDLEKAPQIKDISNLEKLKTGEGYYRIKTGDYRIGILIVDNIVVLLRCLNRKDIYRYFP